MDVVVIREWLMLSNPERGMQEEVFLLPSEELFSSYVEAATGIKDAVATGERYVDDTDTIIMRAYPATYPSAIQHFRSERVLIKDLKQALIDVIDVVSEIHDNNENCPYCGSEYESHTPRDTVEYECPNQDCAGNIAYAVFIRANAYLNGAA